MAAIQFCCTICGRCCYNHSLPLTWDESVSWLRDGGRVSLYCEADPWPVEPPQEDLRAAHRRRRSFAVPCGVSQIRVTAIFVAVASGPCRNLEPDLRCRIYDRRPLVCRIYPAEINPFITFDTANKACPPEAWTAGAPLAVDGQIVDRDMQLLAQNSRDTDQQDAARKRWLCAQLSISVAALKGEGYAIYAPDQKDLLDALTQVAPAGETTANWRLQTASPETTESLRKSGFAVLTNVPAGAPYSFVASRS
jgi:Fe-S-cluster containining protein